ncbi:hypothetical protein ACFWNU_34625, partial [Streptomyces sp. NPDC058427]
MAWRDRLRRRAAGPDPEGRPRSAGRTGAGGPSGDGPDRSAPAGPVPSVPDDWDGGWRRTAPPELTVARAPLGVSDGLAFRARLASWQNPSFDAGLGHALLPTAPTGLVRGVTPPAAPQPTRTGRGPLLLRALRPEGADGPGGGTSDAGAPEAGSAPGPTRAPATARTPKAGARRPGPAPSGARRAATQPSVTHPSVTQPSRSAGTAGTDPGPERAAVRYDDNSPAGKSRSGSTPRSRDGLTSADSPAVLARSRTPVQRAAAPGAGPVVTPSDTGRPAPAAQRIPLVRRVSVVGGAAAGGSVPRPVPAGRAPRTPSGTPGQDSGRVPGPSSTAQGSRVPSSGPAVQRSATEAEGRGDRQPRASRDPGTDAAREVVRTRPVGPLPTVARLSAGPVRRLPALRPAAAPAPAHGTGSRAPVPVPVAPTEPDAPPGTPAQRAATRPGSRAPLGAPLSELPSTSTVLARDAAVPPTAPGPSPALPVVQRHSDGTSGASTTTAGAKGTAPAAPDRPAAPAETPRRASGTRSGARARGGLGAPLSELPPSAGLPGSAASGARAPRTAPGPDIQRAPGRGGRAPGADSGQPAPDRARTGAVPLAPGGGGSDGPLLGTAADRRGLTPGDATSTVRRDATSAVQRHSTDHASTVSAPSAGLAGYGDGPGTPLVTPSRAAASHRPEPGSAYRPASENSHRPAPEGSTGTAGSALSAPRPGSPGSGSPGSGSQGDRSPTTPAPVLIARAPAVGARPPGAPGVHPLTATRSAPNPLTSASRTLSLLAARPLTLNTRVPEGVAPPVAPHSGGRPVVAARWPGAPAAPGAGPERTSPGRSAAVPATPQVQRAATTEQLGHGGRNAAPRGPVQRIPVVRP